MRAITEKRKAMKWDWVLWIVLPILVFGLVEALVRTTTDRIPLWYGAAERVAERDRVDVIFVGSSRVLAAIPTEAFSETVALRTGYRPRTLNLGRGYTTLIEHYLGLRNLLLTHPRSVKGVTVFIEAPGGLGFADHWHDAWVNQQYQLLVDLLRFSDVLDFWRLGGDNIWTKLRVTARFFMRQCALVNRRERIRELWLNQLIPALLEGRTPSLASVDELGKDLQGPQHATNIRSDDAALRNARALAQRYGAEFEHSTVPTRVWAGSVMEDLVRLLQRVDGQLVFFVPPESEVFRRGYRTPLRQEELAIFAEQVRKWGACLVKPAFKYTDEDLPDLWHLRIELASAFTQMVAEEWLAKCESRNLVRTIRVSQ